MAAIDPTRLRVEPTSTPRPPATFDHLMAEQLRRAPWLGVSLLLHAVVLLLLMLMPSARRPLEERFVRLQPPELVEPLVADHEPIPEPLPEPTDEPQLQDVELPDVADAVAERFDDRAEPAASDAALDHPQWNAALGLGGGSGKFGNRGSGRCTLRARGGTDQAVTLEKALDWLAAHQDDDGRWDADAFMKHDDGSRGAVCDGPGNPVHDVGVTALALLAFLGDGSTLRSGPYREQVKRGVAWLKEQQDPDTGLFGSANSNEFVYDHAIAALAMVEAYGLSQYRLLRRHAQAGIDYLEHHRNPYMVWRYQPRDGDNDTSVTGWCVMAYKSAQDFGLDVNASALRLAETWLDQMTDPVTGRTGYTDRGGYGSRRAGAHAVRFPRERNECMTAVALLCRFFLGHDPREHPVMRTQADLLLTRPPVWDAAAGAVDHYAWYYASYALYQMGGRHWKAWERALTDAVVGTQRRDGHFEGSWDPAGVWGDDGGRVYATAMLALTLEAYYRYTRLIR